MGRLFGTDGVRGIANVELTAEIAYRLGAAAVTALKCNAMVIGKDTRISGDMLEMALAAGICSAGADVVLAGVIPTPAVAVLARKDGCAGAVISASHNPYEYNGIKFFNQDGCKLTDASEDEIEALIASGAAPKIGGDIGKARKYENSASRYTDFLINCVAPDLSQLRIVIDCANGAASVTAKKLFSSLNPKELQVIHNEPNGLNINDNCGSTHLDSVREIVIGGGYDAGFAFDGDADRCLCVDHSGKTVDGDLIMAVCALREREAGNLPGGVFVSTVMSNLGLRAWAKEKGLHTASAGVGDRYVLEEMRKGGHLLGGEQSGHVIFLRHTTTGDGQLCALKLLSAMSVTGESLAELISDIPIYPQVLLNVAVKPGRKDTALSGTDVTEAIKSAENALGEKGRVLVRASGTEPLVRVMVEGEQLDEVIRFAEEIAQTVKKTQK